MDFGFRAPTVILFASVDDAGVVRVVDERVAAGVTLDEHVEAIKAWARRNGLGHDGSGEGGLAWVGVDPAGLQANGQTGLSAVQAMQGAGLAVRSRSMKVREGLGLLRARLRPADGSPPRLFVHARCTRLIESLQRYHYPPDHPESLEPVKDGWDHAVDALRYLIVNLDRGYRTLHGDYLHGPARPRGEWGGPGDF